MKAFGSISTPARERARSLAWVLVGGPQANPLVQEAASKKRPEGQYPIAAMAWRVTFSVSRDEP